LLGGQLGYRDYVGVAPDAELMMIRVIGDTNTEIPLETALAIANNTGADVILTEIGSWTWQYLDGSSLVEVIIDDLVADGIPVISPSGNLGGKDKHAMVTTAAYIPHMIDFIVPQLGVEISQVYITVLSVNATDFAASNFSLNIDGVVTYLTPGIGEGNWVLQSNIYPGVDVESYTSVSSRGTRMLAIFLDGPGLPTNPPAPPYQLSIQTPDPATIHAYIADDQSGWSGGCVWTTDMVDSHHITWPSTADSAISVASYHTRSTYGTTGDRASFSSIGPRIDGLSKQSIAAPGGWDIISDYANGSAWADWFNGSVFPFYRQFGAYRFFSGTSASGPHVAGATALLLQADSTIGDQVKTIIESTAVSDSYTGAVPNDMWGGGKLDVEAALLAVMPVSDVQGPIIGGHTRTPSTPNSTESVLIDVTVTDISGVDTVLLSYFNGTAWYNITMSWTGSSYEGVIPAHPNGTAIDYRFYANDTLDNWSVSTMFGYTVTDPGPTTTTTPTTGGPTPTTPPPTEPDYLRLAIILSGVLALILLAVVCGRKKARRLD
jgi:hypothetical protein